MLFVRGEGNSKTFVKDLQGIVGDEDTGEGREKSGKLRVEILLQVKVQVMQGP